MNRRAFFGLIAGGLAAAADPDRTLWVPGRKLISIPAVRLTEDLVNLYLRPALIGIADRYDRDLCSAAPAFYLASHKHSQNDVLIESVPADHSGFPARDYPPWWRGPNSIAGQKRLAELARLGCVPGVRAASAGRLRPDG